MFRRSPDIEPRIAQNQNIKDLPVQVEKPSMSGLVVEVHPHRQHDVVAPVVLRLFRN